MLRITDEPPFREGMSIIVAISHLTLAVLGVFDRLVFTVPSRYPMLIEVMSNSIWIWLHALAGFAVIAAILTRRHQVSTLAASTGVMGSWSFLSFLWGLSTLLLPVSLAGPAMGAVVACLSYALAMSWATSRPDGR